MGEQRIAFTVSQAAKLLEVTPCALYKHIRLGTLRAYRPGGTGRYRILSDDFRAWLAGRPASTDSVA